MRDVRGGDGRLLDYRESRESRDNRDSIDNRDARNSRDIRDSRDNYWDGRDNRGGPNDGKWSHSGFESRDRGRDLAPSYDGRRNEDRRSDFGGQKRSREDMIGVASRDSRDHRGMPPSGRDRFGTGMNRDRDQIGNGSISQNKKGRN